MKELGRICGSAEIVSECQLNVHFHEVEETWKALQWIYNNENQEQGLRYALFDLFSSAFILSFSSRSK